MLSEGLTIGGTVKGDPVKVSGCPCFIRGGTDVTDHGSIQEIIKTAFENGINMFDTAEEYSGGKSEEELWANAFHLPEF